MTQMLESGRNFKAAAIKILQHSAMNSWSSWKSQQRNRIYEENPFGNFRIFKITIIESFKNFDSWMEGTAGKNQWSGRESRNYPSWTAARKMLKKVNRTTKSCRTITKDIIFLSLESKKQRKRSAPKKSTWRNYGWTFFKHGKERQAESFSNMEKDIHRFKNLSKTLNEQTQRNPYQEPS